MAVVIQVLLQGKERANQSLHLPLLRSVGYACRASKVMGLPAFIASPAAAGELHR